MSVRVTTGSVVTVQDRSIEIALTMLEDQRRIRIAQLREGVRRDDIRAWAKMQMQLFDQIGGGRRIRVA